MENQDKLSLKKVCLKCKLLNCQKEQKEIINNINELYEILYSIKNNIDTNNFEKIIKKITKFKNIYLKNNEETLSFCDFGHDIHWLKNELEHLRDLTMYDTVRNLLTDDFYKYFKITKEDYKDFYFTYHRTNNIADCVNLTFSFAKAKNCQRQKENIDMVIKEILEYKGV